MNAVVSYLDKKWEDLLATFSSRPNKDDTRISLNVLIGLWQRFDTLNAGQLYVDRLLSSLTSMVRIHQGGGDYIATVGEAVKVLLVFVWLKLPAIDVQRCIRTMQEFPHTYALDIHHTYAHFFVAQPREPACRVQWSEHTRKWLVSIGSHERTFSRLQWGAYRVPEFSTAAYFVIDRTMQTSPSSQCHPCNIRHAL